MRSSNDSDGPDLEHLLERHLPTLRAYVRKNIDSSLASRESCADLVQSICGEVLQSRGRYRYEGDAAFKQWLTQVALHKLMDRRRFWRARKRDAVRQVSDASQSLRWTREPLGRLAAQLGTPSGEASLHEELRALEAAIARLTAAEREIIQYVHLMGLSHAEMAEKLGCTVPQSRKRLFEALAHLSLLLRPRAISGEGSAR